MPLNRAQRDGVEFIFFLFLALFMMIIGAYVMAAIPSAVGYVIFLFLGMSWTFWSGAAAGIGSLVLIASCTLGLAAIIRAIKS